MLSEASWDPSRGGLLTFLKTLVKNDMLNVLQSASGRRDRLYGLNDGDNKTNIEVNVQLAREGDPTDPEMRIIFHEEEEASEARFEALLEAVGEKPELMDVLEKILDGIEPRPRFLAKALDTSVDDINNRLRKIRRVALLIGRKS